MNLDVQREGDKAARRVARASGTDLATVRKCELPAVDDRYRIATEYEGVTEGELKSWRLGWRKGYGTYQPLPPPIVESSPLSREDFEIFRPKRPPTW